MLQKNKIFLSLLGSFYDNTAYTDFSSRLDYIYTSIIFNRYADIARMAVLSSPGSKGRGTVHFGFVSSSDINPSTGEIYIKDVNGAIVENVNFFSVNFLDIEKFYSVDDGMVDNEAIVALSASTADSIPVTYMIDVSSEIFRNGILKFVENGTSDDFLAILNASLRIISDQMAYYPSTAKLLHRLSNILLGAVYAIDNETILSVSADMVVTTKNTYYLEGINNGRSFVEVGDIVVASDLITELATLNVDIAFIQDVGKIESYINAMTPSISNTVFLRQISSAIVKKSASVIIPPDVFAEVDIEIISAVGDVFELSSAISTNTSSGLLDSIEGSSHDTDGWTVESNYIGEGIINEGWILTVILDSSNVSSESNDGIIFRDESLFFNDSSYIIKGEPIIDSMGANMSEDIAYKIKSDSIVQGITEEIPYGIHVETTILSVQDNLIPLIVNESSIGSSDGGAVFTEAFVINGDTITLEESDVRTISAKRATEIIISDIIATVGLAFDALSVSDNISIFNEIIDSASMVGVENIKKLITTPSVAIMVEEKAFDKAEVLFHEYFEMVESIASSSGMSNTDIVEGNDSGTSGAMILSVKEAVFMTDESDVEGENTIDV